MKGLFVVKRMLKERRSVLVSLEERFEECEVKCDEDPTLYLKILMTWK